MYNRNYIFTSYNPELSTTFIFYMPVEILQFLFSTSGRGVFRWTCRMNRSMKPEAEDLNLKVFPKRATTWESFFLVSWSRRDHLGEVMNTNSLSPRRESSARRASNWRRLVTSQKSRSKKSSGVCSGRKNMSLATTLFAHKTNIGRRKFHNINGSKILPLLPADCSTDAWNRFN